MFLKNEYFSLDLLEKAKEYLKKYITSSSIYNAAHPIHYLASWAPATLGYYKLKCINNGKLISKDFLLCYMRGFLGLGFHKSNKFLYQRVDCVNKSVIVSWCNKGDFLEDGSFCCRYFNENSKKSADVIWVLIALDGFIPSKIDDNIFIFCQERLKKISLFVLAKNVVFCIKNKIPLFAESVFAKKFADFFVEHLNVKKLRQTIIPYEAQPWQHTLSLTLKKINQKIEIVGDLHSCLPPLPTDFIKRSGFPDKVIVHGQGQKDIMVNLLGWDDEDIVVSPSRRLIKNSVSDLAGKILLPYAILDSGFVLDKLKFFFENYGVKLGQFDLRNHPVQTNSREHRHLIQEIKKLQAQYLNYNYNMCEKNISIVIGASSVIIECLSRGIEVFHITNDLVFNGYDHSIWKEIQLFQIEDNIWQYKPLMELTYLDIK